MGLLLFLNCRNRKVGRFTYMDLVRRSMWPSDGCGALFVGLR
jgi:hypothetical protein